MGPLLKFAVSAAVTLAGEKVVAGMLSPETKTRFSAVGTSAKAAARSLGTDLGKAVDAVPGKVDAALDAVERKFDQFERWAMGPRGERNESPNPPKGGSDGKPPDAQA